MVTRQVGRTRKSPSSNLQLASAPTKVDKIELASQPHRIASSAPHDLVCDDSSDTEDVGVGEGKSELTKGTRPATPVEVET